ncbi:MAG: hypothetical protein KBA95_12665 [Acidobacteria bacterium]|nr:hypothetical protein [Acidobacteriota bacterium]
MIRFAIFGAGEYAHDLRRAADKLQPEMLRNLHRASALLVGEAQKWFRGSRTRALYTIRGGRRVKRPHPLPVTSPPHMLGVFEGYYRQQINYGLSSLGKTMTSEVGPAGVIYARIHEFGGRTGRGHGAYMPPRPVLTPAIAKTQEAVFGLLGQSFKVLK